MLPKAAKMLVAPAATAVASPLASMVAVAVLEELHETRLVMSALLPSVKLPMAVNCKLVFTGIEGAAGEIVMDARFVVAVLTFSRAVPLRVPD